MSKININKINELDAVRPARAAEAKQTSETNKTGASDAKGKVAATEDKLQFSERATEVGKLTEQVKQLPDIREDKVNALREKIAAGEFNPSSEQIAAAILKDEK